MQRDIDLIRQLLLKIEALPYPNQYVTFEIAGYDAAELNYHLMIMQEGGLVEAFSNPYSCFDEWNQVRLCWAGHEFLDLARNEAQWVAAKQNLAQQGLSPALDSLRRALGHGVTQCLGLV